jgi:sigma-B regulation protein RsbU (phosphoserine phosphatase)
MANDKGTLLVVDDELVNQTLLASSLEQDGYTVTTADNGRQALEALAAQPFDVVLLDILMPEMDGYQVLERMKADDKLQHIPVIVISALDEMKSVIRCIEMGATDYLPKPFNPVLLRARINASLAAKRLRDREQAYLQVMRHELELGRQIQADFLPEALPQPSGWEIAASFQPAMQVSGDFYDAFALPDGRIVLVIADVCGKGVGAALFMALVRSLIRSFAEQVNSNTIDVFETITHTNNYVARHQRRQEMMFATLFFGVLDTSTGVLTYVNAGHPVPIKVGASGAEEISAPANPALGLFPKYDFVRQQVRLEPGDAIVAYTDGVTEALNADQVPFSKQQLLAVLQQGAPLATDLLKRVGDSVCAYIADQPLSDDTTMLAVVRRNVGASCPYPSATGRRRAAGAGRD